MVAGYGWRPVVLQPRQTESYIAIQAEFNKMPEIVEQRVILQTGVDRQVRCSGLF